MADSNHETLRRLFDLVISAAPGERSAILDRECGGDATLRTRIEAMIAAAEDDRFLAEPTRASDDASPTAEFSAAAGTIVDSLREGPGTRIGPYKLLQLIGEGGFGSVFMAEQEKPVSRKVALKIIKLGMDTHQVVARFEQERQALAMMDHPNIARVLDAGATETGRPFFVMELVKGDPIVDYCDKNNLTIQDRLELFAQVCTAVQHAHTKGIIHRDLKPSNILVSTQDGRPLAKVIDFGIAKATASKLTEKTLFTEHRALIGTPEYMSPEQAEGSLDIDTRTDVYSLGVLLYELLTGTTPFSGKELRSAAYAEIQRIIREVDPPRPSTRVSHNADTLATVAARRHIEPRKLGTVIRGELDWIVMKALEKDRQRRYETATGLALDIRRYLAGEAVLAAPPSAAYKFKKFIRRHKGPVAAAATVLVVLLAGLAGTLWKADEARREATRANTEAAAARAAESEQRRLAESESKARTIADLKTAEVAKAAETIQANAYIANMESAAAAMEFRLFDRVRQRLDDCPERLRGWEWRWVNAGADNSLVTFKGHADAVTRAAFSPDGRLVASAGGDGGAWVWDAATGAALFELKGHGHGSEIETIQFSADGARILTASWDHTARLWDALTGAGLFVFKGHTGGVNCAAFSSDGKRIVTGSLDKTARVWDAATGATLLELKGHTREVRTAAFSPDGSRIATASLDGAEAFLWDAATGASIAELKGHTRGMWTIAFNRDGTKILTASLDKTARLWDAATGAFLVELNGHTGGIWFGAFSPDGTRIVTASLDKTARVWDASTGASLLELKGHTERVFSAAFSSDGTRIVTASKDLTARVWDATTGAPLSELRGHTGMVFWARFSPEGNRIVTASTDHTARIWDAQMDLVRSDLVGHTDQVDTASFSPDGKRVVTTAKDQTVRLWDVATGSSLAELNRPGDDALPAPVIGAVPYALAAFSPDGVRIVTGSRDQAIRIWDAATGAYLTEFKGHTDAVTAAAFSPDGRRIVTTSVDKTARVWDAATGKSLVELKGHTNGVLGAAFSPDGRRIVTGSWDATARLWDSATGTVVAELEKPGVVFQFVFDARGERFITTSWWNPSVRVWNATTGAPVAELKGHADGVSWVAFSPDGTRLVTASPDNTARVWDTTTWACLLELKGHSDQLHSAEFSPDGTRIVTSSMDKTARIWDAATGASLAELRGHTSVLYSASFSPDGTLIVTTSADKSARIWDSVPYRERFRQRQAKNPR